MELFYGLFHVLNFGPLDPLNMHLDLVHIGDPAVSHVQELHLGALHALDNPMAGPE